MHPRAPVIALDGDQSGRRVTAALAGRIAQRGREAAIVSWPAGKDPASWLDKHGPGGLAAVTRRGCLEAEGTQLRPRHAAAALIDNAGASLDAKVAAALATLAQMTPTVAQRYAKHAAEAIAPVVVDAGASIACDIRGRDYHIIETVTTSGKKFPVSAQQRFVELAVLELEQRELAPGAWAERQISRRLGQSDSSGERSVSGAVVAPVQATSAG